MTLVIALGGNALLRRGEAMDMDTQRRNARQAARALAPLFAQWPDIVLTHGNGPQVGLLALQAQASGTQPITPLDVLDAESEGMIGYLLQQALMNEIPGRHFAALLTQVEVAADDPAFSTPSKPIGPVFAANDWQQISARHGWTGVEEGPGQWRRVVPSPRPLRVLDVAAIQALQRQGIVPICAGGGGVPVVRSESGHWQGVEAVVDKDHTAALLAATLKADMLMLLTDVAAVYGDWPEMTQPFHHLSAAQAATLSLPAGSMAPKVQAGLWFVQHTGGRAVIGALDQAAQIVSGQAGTRLVA